MVARSHRQRLTPTVRAVMELFAIRPEQTAAPAPPNLPPVLPGQIMLISGASGTGKSTFLTLLSDAVVRSSRTFLKLEAIATDEPAAVVDCFPPLPLKTALAVLARAGLAEARLLIRRPAELSEGERFRFRLAQFYASPAAVLVADEFGATLDRVTARIVAYNLRQFISRSGQRSAIVVTSHEDLAADLRPDVWIRKELEGGQ
jgi:uncharacterized protein